MTEPDGVMRMLEALFTAVLVGGALGIAFVVLKMFEEPDIGKTKAKEEDDDD